MTAHLKAVEKSASVHSLIGDMESTISVAVRLANALGMAILGREQIAMQEEDKEEALQELSFFVCDAVGKCRKQWMALHDLSSRERSAAE